MTKNEKPQSAGIITRKLARDVTGPHNQDRALLVEGDKGSGKSSSGLTLALLTAGWINHYLNQKPLGHPGWKKYFNPSENMAIIHPDELTRITENLKRHNVYILDDIGVGLSSRKWHSEENEAINDLIETMRTYNCVLIYTVPHDFMIDKIARSLYTSHYELEYQPDYFEHGYAIGKYFDVVRSRVKGKTLNIYPRQGSAKFARVLTAYPPKPLWKWYERERALQLERLRRRSVRKLKHEEQPTTKRRGEEPPQVPVNGDGKFALPEPQDLEALHKLVKSPLFMDIDPDKVYNTIYRVHETKQQRGCDVTTACRFAGVSQAFYYTCRRYLEVAREQNN